MTLLGNARLVVACVVLSVVLISHHAAADEYCDETNRDSASAWRTELQAQTTDFPAIAARKTSSGECVCHCKRATIDALVWLHQSGFRLKMEFPKMEFPPVPKLARDSARHLESACTRAMETTRGLHRSAQTDAQWHARTRRLL